MNRGGAGVEEECERRLANEIHKLGLKLAEATMVSWIVDIQYQIFNIQNIFNLTPLKEIQLDFTLGIWYSSGVGFFNINKVWFETVRESITCLSWKLCNQPDQAKGRWVICVSGAGQIRRHRENAVQGGEPVWQTDRWCLDQKAR